MSDHRSPSGNESQRRSQALLPKTPTYLDHQILQEPAVAPPVSTFADARPALTQAEFHSELLTSSDAEPSSSLAYPSPPKDCSCTLEFFSLLQEKESNGHKIQFCALKLWRKVRGECSKRFTGMAAVSGKGVWCCYCCRKRFGDKWKGKGRECGVCERFVCVREEEGVEDEAADVSL